LKRRRKHRGKTRLNKIALLFRAQSAIARSEKITQFIGAPVIDLRVKDGQNIYIFNKNRLLIKAMVRWDSLLIEIAFKTNTVRWKR
jgi:hypothetical protein